MNRIKAIAGRVRIRLTALGLTLLVVLPELLDQLGVINLRPLLEPILGARTEAVIVVITILISVMKPMVALCPKHERPRYGIVGDTAPAPTVPTVTL